MAITTDEQVTTELQPRVDPILLKVARLLREEGWIQHHSHNSNGYCLSGAIARVLTDETESLPPEERSDRVNVLWSRTVQKLGFGTARLNPSQAKPPRHVKSLFDGGHIPPWNDHPERTKEEVIKRVEDAAVGEVSNEVR